MEERFYIANQGDVPGIDEVRWLVSAVARRKHIALAGDPGHGKSSAIRFAAELMDKPVFSRNCQLHEQTFDYLGRPILEDGKTAYSITRFTSALKEGAILINEETSEMPPEIQKYLSTLLSDNYPDFVVLDEKGNERTLRYMRDVEGWNIGRFVYTETFNPPMNNTGRDNFEFSHKSRVTPFTFKDLDSLLSAHIAFTTMGESFSLPLEERGVLWNPGSSSHLFTEKRNGIWTTSTGVPLDGPDIQRQKRYRYFDRAAVHEAGTREPVIAELRRKGSFYHDFMVFLTGVRGLVNPEVFAYDSLGPRAARLIPEKDKAETLLIVYPDQRMVTDGFQAYRDYRQRFDEQTARLGATFDTLNKMLHGALAARDLNNNCTQEEFLRMIAAELGLLPRPEDGVSEAEDFVSELPGGVGHGVGMSTDEF